MIPEKSTKDDEQDLRPKPKEDDFVHGFYISKLHFPGIEEFLMQIQQQLLSDDISMNAVGAAYCHSFFQFYTKEISNIDPMLIDRLLNFVNTNNIELEYYSLQCILLFLQKSREAGEYISQQEYFVQYVINKFPLPLAYDVFTCLEYCNPAIKEAFVNLDFIKNLLRILSQKYVGDNQKIATIQYIKRHWEIIQDNVEIYEFLINLLNPIVERSNITLAEIEVINTINAYINDSSTLLELLIQTNFISNFFEVYTTPGYTFHLSEILDLMHSIATIPGESGNVGATILYESGAIPFIISGFSCYSGNQEDILLLATILQLHGIQFLDEEIFVNNFQFNGADTDNFGVKKQLFIFTVSLLLSGHSGAYEYVIGKVDLFQQIKEFIECSDEQLIFSSLKCIYFLLSANVPISAQIVDDSTIIESLNQLIDNQNELYSNLADEILSAIEKVDESNVTQ
ncbi:hypothetical protein TVAG_344800 [Trichomonas vaginalis G3]|uniref:Uncharacterized protein n=1 Tax=Trichomonas vaginalis (strain ATCC PRA-98 / G3) TaxID=412133 RepID=A2FVN1_TRIV3|nr:armadillo (ARM) repeat-containing protein family [Trichomonas vaginalis G3]EAX91046.1 hypothetical protein TVAG_344800 [Trichomonas vaginalis G3]KAI5487080.1 armadillo (ARM) repeat-containing protein family [Trichomonas vaginalis G3]|eukprot:XP_001303976.1 hypothetical protein [Trichomonas vaginalis G3]